VRIAKGLAPLIPYVAVAIGLYGFGSAWAAMGLYHAGALTVVAWAGRRKPVAARAAQRAWTIPAAVVFATGGIILYLLWPYAFADGRGIAARLAAYGVSRGTWPFLAAYFCLINSTAEELFWRGYLGSDCKRPVANDLLFAGYHVLVLLAFVGPLYAVPVFGACAFAGWLWRMMRASTGSLVIPLLTHVIADLSIAIAVHLRVFA
jgi:membrane protease YdiL (CAAX protease family)